MKITVLEIKNIPFFKQKMTLKSKRLVNLKM